MKKIILLLITIVTLSSCEQAKQNVHSYTAVYDVQSVRIDDDGEYHIVAVSKSGNVKVLHDVDDGFNVYIKYGNYDKPTLSLPISDRDCGEGNYSADDYETVLLPLDYKIETFND